MSLTRQCMTGVMPKTGVVTEVVVPEVDQASMIINEVVVDVPTIAEQAPVVEQAPVRRGPKPKTK